MTRREVLSLSLVTQWPETSSKFVWFLFTSNSIDIQKTQREEKEKKSFFKLHNSFLALADGSQIEKQLLDFLRIIKNLIKVDLMFGLVKKNFLRKSSEMKQLTRKLKLNVMQKILTASYRAENKSTCRVWLGLVRKV